MIHSKLLRGGQMRGQNVLLESWRGFLGYTLLLVRAAAAAAAAACICNSISAALAAFKVDLVDAELCPASSEMFKGAPSSIFARMPNWDYISSKRIA